MQDQGVTLAANRTVNTLRLYSNGATARTVNLGGFTLTLAAGGLMIGQDTDGANYTISNGALTAGAPGVGGDLYVHKLGYTASSATGRRPIAANLGPSRRWPTSGTRLTTSIPWSDRARQP